jgi:uncharacterized repeat protein (TIGR02543 family)
MNDGVKVTCWGDYQLSGNGFITNGCEQWENNNKEFHLTNGGAAGSTGTNAIMTINGGTYEGGIFTVKNGDWDGEMTINGGTFSIKDSTSGGASNWGAVISNSNNCTMTINNGTFNGAATGIDPVVKAKTKSAQNEGTGLTIKGGTFAGPSDVLQTLNKYSNGSNTSPNAIINAEGGSFSGTINLDTEATGLGDTRSYNVDAAALKISGGYYTADPSAYVVDGKAAVESDKAGYLFMIGEKSSTPAEVKTADPVAVTTVKKDSEHSAEDVALAAAVVNTVKESPSVSPDVIAAAANTVANNNTITEEEAKAKLTNAGISVTTATVVVQTYLDIKVVDAKVTEEGGTTTKTLTLDITPMYQLLVTNADNPKTDTLNDQNSVPIGAPKELTITRPVVIQVNVGNALDTATIAFVIHYAKVGTRIYKGTVTNGILGFINPDGFSDFKVSTESPAVAEIGDTGYTSLQDAVDNAQNGETIKLTKDGQSAVVSRNVSFTVDTNGTTGNTITAGSYTKVATTTANGKTTYTFTYTAPAGSPVLYFETNGGSKLSSVTVASGSSVSLASYKPTRDGYTFTGWYADKALTKPVTSVTMAGDVTVYAGWEKADANPFRDVAAKRGLS